MELDLLALSDDLTGAVSCAAELSRDGAPVSIRTWQSPVPNRKGTLVIDCASRLLHPDEACTRTRAVLTNHGLRATFYYKRIDSGLRGNVGAEVETIADVLNRPCVFAPAAPAFGVTTQGGTQLLADHPITHSAYGEEPSRAASPRLAELFRRRHVTEIGLDDVRGEALGAMLEEAVGRGEWVVCDGTTHGDLRLVANALLALPDNHIPLVVGTYGLARALSRGTLRAHRGDGPGVLIVSDSLKAATARQIECAADLGVRVVTYTEDNQCDHVATTVNRLVAGDDVILSSHPWHSATAPIYEPAVATRVADDALQVITTVRPKGLVVIGGELASSLLQLAEVKDIFVLSEPWPTAPVVAFDGGGVLDGLRAVIKSGAQGSPTWLVNAVDTLRNLAVMRASPKDHPPAQTFR